MTRAITLDKFNAQVEAYFKLHKVRLKRSLAFGSDELKDVLNVIPIALHINHPTFPFYVGNSPYGIHNFKLSSYLDEREKSSFFSNLENFEGFDNNQDCEIEGIYTMGSTSSIVQGHLSDLDIWVILSSIMPDIRKEAINVKCKKIEVWAKSLNVEVNFFIVSTDKFINYEIGLLSDEDSGYLQHFLLLDEFYRTATFIAGKMLLWPCINVPDTEYKQTKQQLIDEKVIIPEEWIDLGDFTKIDKNELVGSIYWHILKSTKDPYKSIIKIILLEVYLYSEDLKTELLSYTLKSYINDQEVLWHEFDSYLLMLEKVLNYLTVKKDYKRYLLVIIGFMLKLDLIYEVTPWEQKKITELFTRFPISKLLFNQLTSIEDWHPEKKVAYFNIFDKYIIKTHHQIQDKLKELDYILPKNSVYDLSMITYQIYTKNKSRRQIILNKENGIRQLFYSSAVKKASTDAYLVNSDMKLEPFIIANNLQKSILELPRLRLGWYLILPVDKDDIFSIDNVSFSRSLLKLLADAITFDLITYKTDLNLLLNGISKNLINYAKQKLYAYLTKQKIHIPDYSIKVIILAYNKQGERTNLRKAKSLNLLSYIEIFIEKIEVIVIQNGNVLHSKIFLHDRLANFIDFTSGFKEPNTIFDIITEDNTTHDFIEEKLMVLISLYSYGGYDNNTQLQTLKLVEYNIENIDHLNTTLNNGIDLISVSGLIDSQLFNHFKLGRIQFYISHLNNGNLKLVISDQDNLTYCFSDINTNVSDLIHYLFKKFVTQNIPVNRTDEQDDLDLMDTILKQHFHYVVDKKDCLMESYNVSIKKELDLIRTTTTHSEFAQLVNSTIQTLDKISKLEPNHVVPIIFYIYDPFLCTITMLDNI